MRQHLVTGHGGGFAGEVRILNVAQRQIGVVFHVRQVSRGVAQAVNARTHFGTHGADVIQRGFQVVHQIFRAGSVSNVDAAGRVVAAACIANRAKTAAGINQRVGARTFQLFRQINLHGFIGGRANLEVHRFAKLTGSAEQFVTCIGGVFHDVLQLRVQVVQLGVDGIAVFGGVGVVRCLGGKVFHAVHDVAHFVERTFGGL